MTPVILAQDENQSQKCKNMKAKHRDHFCVLIRQLGGVLHGSKEILEFHRNYASGI